MSYNTRIYFLLLMSIHVNMKLHQPCFLVFGSVALVVDEGAAPLQ